jgi:hypothetical protein
MGYKDYSSNLNIRPRRIIVPTDVGSHSMGYKDYSSNLNIRPRRIIVLDDTLTIHLAGNHFQHY